MRVFSKKNKGNHIQICKDLVKVGMFGIFQAMLIKIEELGTLNILTLFLNCYFSRHIQLLTQKYHK